jgi:hypothetical protein
MGAVPNGLDDKTLLKFIREARVTVHLLGAENDPVIRQQIDLALGTGKRTVFCLMRAKRQLNRIPNVTGISVVGIPANPLVHV